MLKTAPWLIYSSPGRYLISGHSLHVKYEGIRHSLLNFRFHFALQLIDQRNVNCYWSYWAKQPSNWASHWSNPPLGASYSQPLFEQIEDGNSLINTIISSIYILDYATIYMAVSRYLDPSPTPAVGSQGNLFNL